jgi:hypothetical protein
VEVGKLEAGEWTRERMTGGAEFLAESEGE